MSKRVSDIKEPYLVESPHGWKDLAIWKYIPRRKFVVGVSLFCAAVTYRQYKLIGHTPGTGRLTEDLTGKTMVVTGSTSGVGKSTAMILAKRGARVVLACRDTEKCAAVRKEMIHACGHREVVCRHVDLSDLSSVRKFASHINATEEKLHGLVNCAATMLDPKTNADKRKFTKDGFEYQMGVNYFGPFLLTNLLADKILASTTPTDRSRIVTVGCNSCERGTLDIMDVNADGEGKYSPRRQYYNSKQASMLFSRELARRMCDKSVTVVSVGFSFINTALDREHIYHRSWWRWLVLKPVLMLVSMDPGEAARSVCAAVMEPAAYSHHGRYVTVDGPRSLPQLDNDELAIKLWKLSEKWTGIDHDHIKDPHIGSAETTQASVAASEQKLETKDQLQATGSLRSNLASSAAAGLVKNVVSPQPA